MTVPVTLTWMRSPLLPKMPLKVGRLVQRLAEQKCLEQANHRKDVQLSAWPLIGEVVGYTTPAVQDIGMDSLRLKFHDDRPVSKFIQRNQDENNNSPGIREYMSQPKYFKECSFKEDLRKLHNINEKDDINRNILNDGGGFLLAIRSHKPNDEVLSDEFLIENSGFLPAIAGIPGKKGLDRYGNSRVASAELIIMGRPLASNKQHESDDQSFNKAIKNDSQIPELTFFSEDTISQVFPIGSLVEVINIARVTDFFLGLNAGRWLTIRIKEICDKGVKHVIIQCDNPKVQNETYVGCEKQEPSIEDINEYFLVHALKNMKVLDFNNIEEPPEDASYLFHHWGAGGNSGVSGQRIVLEKEEIAQRF